MKRQLLHTPEGVRDIYGPEFDRKLRLQEELHGQLKLYGYQDIQTPTFEFFDVFSREIGTTPSKELYKFFDKEGNTLVLRPDFTPSIARAAAKYFKEESAPIRFCYSGDTFLNNSNLQGLLKETTQLGAELIGAPDVDADGEMLVLMIECMRRAGLQEFQISVGNVAFFKGICAEAGIDEETEGALREMISNKNYFGAEQILEELHIHADMEEVILKVIDMAGAPEMLAEARKLVKNPVSLEAIGRLEQAYEVVRLYGLEKYVSFGLDMLSKYNYYTGIIFKAYTYGVGDAIMKGGRYDGLLTAFGKEAAAIGFVILLDQVLSAISSQKLEQAPAADGLLILYEAAVREKAIRTAMHYRARQIRTQLTLLPAGKKPEDYAALARRQQIGRILHMAPEQETDLILEGSGSHNIIM